MKRRTFIKQGVEAAAVLAASKALGAGQAADTGSSNRGKLPTRPYGKEGVLLSIIGFGGIAVSKIDQQEANRGVAEAVERGVTYFDVAPTYGNAEDRLGPALEPYRKDVFLACKTTQRHREEAGMEFKRSLERLRTDHFDLYQLHGLGSVERDVEPIFEKGGVMDMLLDAKKAGQVRYVGFSAHTVEAAFAALDRYAFDSVLFPINFCAYYKGNFGSQLIARVQEKGATLLALKAMARQKWPKDDPEREKYSKCWYQPLTEPREAQLGLRWTLSQPVAAAVSPGEWSLLKMAMDIGARFTPISEDETATLKELAGKLDPIFHAA